MADPTTQQDRPDQRQDQRDKERDAELADELKNEPQLSHKPGRLTPEQEAEIETRRQQNVLAATIAGLSWGRNMSPVVRRAFADYCARYDVDPITEMDNLGGQPYVNADWYKRKLGELIVRGIVKDYTLEHVHADRRLQRIMDDEKWPQQYRDEAREKWFDNAMRRIEHNAPEEAEAVCICTIYLPNGTKAIGCKWAGGGTSVRQPRHTGGALPNPIAEMNPALSVESMSIRRALSQMLSHVSGKTVSALHWPDLSKMEDELNPLAAAARAEQPPRADSPEPGHTRMIEGTYDVDDAAELERKIKERNARGIETVEIKGQPYATAPGFAAFAASQDPYGFDAPLDTSGFDAPLDTFGAPEEAHVVESAPQRMTVGETMHLPPSRDLFGDVTPVESPSVECEVCGRWIRPGHPEDHEVSCDGHRS